MVVLPLALLQQVHIGRTFFGATNLLISWQIALQKTEFCVRDRLAIFARAGYIWIWDLFGPVILPDFTN
jgi:hypothetical protein